MLEESCFSEPTTKRIDQRFVTRTHHNALQDREAINTHDLGRRAPRQRLRIQAVQGRPKTSEPTVQEEQLLVAGYCRPELVARPWFQYKVRVLVRAGVSEGTRVYL